MKNFQTFAPWHSLHCASHGQFRSPKGTLFAIPSFTEKCRHASNQIAHHFKEQKMLFLSGMFPFTVESSEVGLFPIVKWVQLL